jgi:hypothetical protein
MFMVLIIVHPLSYHHYIYTTFCVSTLKGVSNFNIAQLQLLKGATPAVNQIAISIMPFWGNKYGQ